MCQILKLIMCYNDNSQQGSKIIFLLIAGVIFSRPMVKANINKLLHVICGILRELATLWSCVYFTQQSTMILISLSFSLSLRLQLIEECSSKNGQISHADFMKFLTWD